MFNNLSNVITNSNAPTYDGRLDSMSAIGSVVINVMIGIVVSFSLIGLAYGFVQYVINRGDPKKIATAQNAVIWSAISMVVALGAVAFKNIFLRLIGVESPELLNDQLGF